MKPKRLREAHIHLAWHARMMRVSRGSLAGCRSHRDVLDMVREAVAEAHSDADTVILLPDARPEGWDEASFPTRADLDAAARGAPVVLRTFDYHSMMASSAALALAQIDDRTRDPEGGRIVRDSAGEITGVLLEAACGPVNELFDLNRVDGDDLRAMFGAEPFDAYHEMLMQPELGPVLATIEREGDIPFPAVEMYAAIDALDEAVTRSAGWQSDRLRLAGGKIFVDGTLNSRTAWMLEPYADGPPEHPAGMALMKPTGIEDAIRRCAAHGLRLACHAIGDGAVRAVLDAVERVRPPRWTVRIEHAEVIDVADVQRFADLGVIASVQPCHLLTDIEALSRAIPDRLDRVLPMRDLIDAGLEPGQTLLFGSDAPIVRTDPGDSIRAAVHRSRPDSAAIAPEQAITEAEAWACFDADRAMPDIGGV